jgi:hypothetical protein
MMMPRMKKKERSPHRAAARAGDRALTRDELDDTVCSIAKELAPLRRKIGESEIRERIDQLKLSLGHMRVIPAPTSTRAAAARIAKRLDPLIKEIEQLPRGAAFEFRRVAAVCGLPAGWVERLKATLEVLRSRRGLSGHVDRENLVCAMRAYKSINEFSKRAPSGSEGAPFLTIVGKKLSGFSKAKTALDARVTAVAAEEKGEFKSFRIHDLRRTVSTGMAAIGIQPHVIEAVLNDVSGHTSGVAGIYNKYEYHPEKKAALERRAAHVDGIVSKRAVSVTPLRGGRK